jgi:hypothetical protein
MVERGWEGDSVGLRSFHRPNCGNYAPMIFERANIRSGPGVLRDPWCFGAETVSTTSVGQPVEEPSSKSYSFFFDGRRLRYRTAQTRFPTARGST